MSYKIIVRTPLDNKITLIINDISEILKENRIVECHCGFGLNKCLICEVKHLKIISIKKLDIKYEEEINRDIYDRLIINYYNN